MRKDDKYREDANQIGIKAGFGYGLHVEKFDGMFGIAVYLEVEGSQQKYWFPIHVAKSVSSQLQEKVVEAEEKNKFLIN